MQFTTLAVAALLGLASAKPTGKRSVATIESDLSSVESNLATLTSAVAAYDGSLLESFEMLIDFNDLGDSLTTATSDVNSNGVISATDSATVYSDLVTVSGDFSTMLTDVNNKASTFVSSGYANYALEYLQTLQNDTATFYAAFAAEIDTSYTAKVQTYGSLINSQFTAALADF